MDIYKKITERDERESPDRLVPSLAVSFASKKKYI
jgi:hypothetical protein